MTIRPIYSVWCDYRNGACPNWEAEYPTEIGAIDYAQRCGWIRKVFRDKKTKTLKITLDLCPKHKDYIPEDYE